MINTIDKTGEPRSIEELKEAQEAIHKALVRFDITSPLTIHLTVIKDALKELIEIREFLESKQKK